jgi:molybdopterin molybdotransferase
MRTKSRLEVGNRDGGKRAVAIMTLHSPPSAMHTPQRLPASLTPLDAALSTLLKGLDPVAPTDLALADAVGAIAADMPPPQARPPFDVAAIDGWAFRARDLVGASPYSPLPIAAPAWIEAGDPLPEGCDCVVDADAVEQTGSMFQVLAEAIPGQGVRRAGGAAVIVSGRPVGALGLFVVRMAGRDRLAVRRPRLRVVNIPAAAAVTAALIAESAAAAGAEVTGMEAGGRDAGSVAAVLEPESCDLLVTIGGTGVGRSDATIAALASRGALLAHGIALQPGRTAATGRIGARPVVALPGAPDQALAGWWTLALPVLDRLSGRRPRQTMRLPLARKIASSVGLAEIVLLKNADRAWLPLASGELSLDAIARADAWLAVPAGSEGYAAGILVDAYPLCERP